MALILLIKKIIFKSEEKNKTKAIVLYNNQEYTLFTMFFDWLQEENSIIAYGKTQEALHYIYASACIPYLEKTLSSFKTFMIAAKISGLTANKIDLLIKKFGKDIIPIFFEENFEKLKEIPFFTEEKIIIIQKQWKSLQVYSMLHLALYQSGLSASSVKKLYKTYKEEALKKLQENPYQIIETVGYGFLTADKIAQEYGIGIDSPIRIESAISYILKKNESEGNSYLSIEHMKEALKHLLKLTLNESDLLYYLEMLEKKSHIIMLEKTYIARNILYKYESFIYLFFKNNIRIKNKIQSLSFSKKNLVEEQKKAIEGACSYQYSIITGAAGTGKSTCVGELFNILTGGGKKVLILAPTGRASQRIKELINEATSMTIHKALGIKYIQEIYRNNLYEGEMSLPYDHIIVDETSMIDAFIFYCFLKKVRKDTAITLIGDKNQLPPIGPGAIFDALIETKTIPTFTLGEIHRQEKNNTIIGAAKKIAEGSFPKISEDPRDNCYFESLQKEKLERRLISLVKNLIHQKNNLFSFQILTFLHKGIAGITTINFSIQKTLAELRNNKDEKKFFDKFFIGDKVIVTKNNYDLGIFNGEIGIIKEGDIKTITIEFTDKEIVIEETYAYLIELAYAISIHKSQGSEFPLVILLLYPEQYILLNKKSLYTGLTRGKQKVHIIGEKKCLYIALKKEYNKKNTSLIPIIKNISTKVDF